MFEKLKNETKVIVTGCQRSGTRIASKMIAYDLGLPYIDELEYNIHSESDLLKILEKHDRFVLHAPNWVSMRLIPFAPIMQSIFVVYVSRSPKDICRSMERINWAPKARTVLERLGVLNPEPWHMYALPTMIQMRWKHSIKPRLTKYLGIEYTDLKNHIMWIDKEDRKEFVWNQTKPL
ncbi:MAG: hypothetical protein U9M89_01770 [Patescibacteria group bacterium]|nr:hypothetical protein [Patescibacteria group bacterium]